MTIETVLNTRLSNFAGLTALVSTRIYPNMRAQDAALPCIAFRVVSPNRYSAMGADTGLVKARYQVDVYASTYKSAKEVAAQVRAALQRWRTVVGSVVQDTFILNETDIPDTDLRQHHVAIDVEINYIE